MFQLNIKRESSELSYVFDQAKLILGSKGSPPVDLTLSDPTLLPVHLAIFRKGKDYFAENVGHDPHTLVSGIPFWKKRLKSGDVISLGRSTITFFQLASPAHPEDEIAGGTPLSLPPPLKEKAQGHPTPSAIARETNLIERLSPEHTESPLHVWLLLAGLVLIFVALFGLAFTLTMREKAENERIVAGRQLADLGMLLTYAQLYSIEPTHKNFLDPEFLKGIVPKVLHPSAAELSWLDKEGHMEGADYHIRIYSDGDLERFIILAQPEHHFFQSLVPAWTLVLDSEEMIVKSTQDLRELNRLLAEKVGGLEGTNLSLVTQKIRELEEIPLKILATEKDTEGFAPPEELTYIDPRGGHFIYNAPRYFLFNQHLIEMIKELGEKKEEADLLKKEISLRSRFPLMIFYTALGIESAIDARKIFSEEWAEMRHLIGYLEVDEKGTFGKSHLLMMGNRTSFESHEESNSEAIDPLATYQEHPLYRELLRLLEVRKVQLQPYYASIVGLLEDHIIHTDRQFFLRYHLLYDAFQDALKRSQEEIDSAVNELCEKYVFTSGEMTISMFSTILDLAGVEVGYDKVDILPSIRPILTLHPGLDQLETLFAEIQKAISIPVLDQTVALAHDLLNQEIFQNHQGLNSWQNQLRSLVIYKLETLLWVPHIEGLENFNRDELRWMVSRILKNGYITENDKREFYLSHIDKRLSQKEDRLLSGEIYP